MSENLVQRSMPIFEGKKVENIGTKVNAQQKQALEEVCENEDRPMSYVLRELALRGLALYKQDGFLKLTEIEEKVIAKKSGIEFGGDIDVLKPKDKKKAG